MTDALFIVGLLTAVACGLNVVTFQSRAWWGLLIWTLSAFGGAGLMILAIWMQKEGF